MTPNISLKACLKICQSALAKMRWFPVISKNSSFVFRGKPVDEKTIGRVLGARYLLEGSVRLRGNQLRVTAQLVNAEEGVNIWTNTYQYPLENIFDLQDEIAQNIISALSTQIDQAEQSRSYAKPYEKFGYLGFGETGGRGIKTN